LLAQIEDVLARERGAVCVSLLGIAETFAQVDQRLAGIEAKLERLLAAPPAEKIGTGAVTNSSAREQLITLLDQRIKAALDRDHRERCEATADIMRNAMKDFVDEFKQVRGEVEAKLIQLRTLLAERAPVDPRPN
jgi:hypothetical protein